MASDGCDTGMATRFEVVAKSHAAVDDVICVGCCVVESGADLVETSV